MRDSSPRLRMRFAVRALLMVWGFFLGPAVARAGMPAPLPTDPERLLRLNDSVAARLQTFSFFLLVLLGAAAAVRLLWNHFRRDFPRLPRLTFGRALAAVLLWGLWFVVVLTMISGARELMTPGAWQKQGFTYKLADAVPPADADPARLRRQHLERLRTALWQFAATHNGRFPAGDERRAIPDELWTIPDTGGMRYEYFPGRSAAPAASAALLLAVEPELEVDRRPALLTDGDVLVLRSTELRARRETEAKP